MVERQDIDALLISALYGELTPADEKRLAAHLESHPADRTALDDLTRARAALRESRILQYQLEPPQSVTALLMQEAARRAPKKVADGESEGWFARFVRSFVQQPAWAAAAMLVIVVGAAALVSRSTGQRSAETTPVSAVDHAETTAMAPGAEPAAEVPPAAPSPSAGGGSGMPADGAYRVDLVEGAPGGLGDNKQGFYLDGKDADQAAGDRVTAKPAKVDAKRPEPKPEAKKQVAKSDRFDTGLELRREQAQPKELDEERANDVAQLRARTRNAEIATDDATIASRGAQGPAAGRGAPAQAEMPGGAVAPTTTAPSNRPAVTANATPTPAPAPPPPGPAPKGTKSATVARDEPHPAEKTKTANDPNLAWARDQHAALVAQVKQNNCGRAATIALSIANRAPAYYAQSVETDRSVKPCIAFINNERETELRAQRAKKARLNATESPAPKRAADEPAKATTESIK